MNKYNNYIWLFGENLGKTCNNNSFYFWKHIVNMQKYGINKYIIVEKNKKNKKIYKNLSKTEKKSVIWRNSLKHYILYKQADMYFVTLSYKDITPDRVLFKKYKPKIKRPLIYLQHGTIAMKKITYGGRTYNNNLLRFVYYNKNIKEELINTNEFRRYQLYYGEFHPRYKELIRRNIYKKDENKNEIFWFLTWREYKDNSVENKIFIKKIRKILNDTKLNNYLEKTNTKIKVCIHQLYNIDKNSFILPSYGKNIEIVYANEIDIMDELVNSKLLITDYSSLGFDFTFLNKPVILFQPDLEDYSKLREFYCDIDELKENSIENGNDLINKIISEKYEMNKFFTSRIDTNIDYEYIKEGKHIEKMYAYFRKLQKNKITFLGYNFHGVGGTVSATRSLAEGLLEKGYMVELLSLKVIGEPKKMPCALNCRYIYSTRKKGNIIERIRRFFVNKKKQHMYAKYDSGREYVESFAWYFMEKILKRIRSNTVISTRESLHLFLNDAKSNKIKNKIYFFHCSADSIEENFPGIMQKIKEIKLKKVAFVTEKNRQRYIEKFNYDNYDNYIITGNAIERKNVRNINKIEKIEVKDKYFGIYLLRISSDRVNDIQNLIGFAKYLKEKNINNIVIDVYGDGDYVNSFIDILVNEDLTKYIHYKGKTNDPTHYIRNHDVLIDFSLNNSFGMTYIEGVLSGKKVYCMRNTGSLEVMSDIPNTYIESYDDLIDKINNLPNVTIEELKENYRKIEEKYSRKVVSKKFVEYIKLD